MPLYRITNPDIDWTSIISKTSTIAQVHYLRPVYHTHRVPVGQDCTKAMPRIAVCAIRAIHSPKAEGGSCPACRCCYDATRQRKNGNRDRRTDNPLGNSTPCRPPNLDTCTRTTALFPDGKTLCLHTTPTKGEKEQLDQGRLRESRKELRVTFDRILGEEAKQEEVYEQVRACVRLPFLGRKTNKKGLLVNAAKYMTCFEEYSSLAAAVH